MTPEDLKKRTKKFALCAITLVERLPHNKVGDVLGRQLLRAATAVGANYRSACRARSKADFAYKVGLAEEESDEAGYWLELIMESDILGGAEVVDLLREADELTAIFTASGRTAKRNR